MHQTKPKVTWLTITGRDVEIHDSFTASSSSCNGLTFKVLVHLDLHVDLESRGPPREFTWRLGVVDGERSPRNRHDHPPNDRFCRLRHDDYD